jgi:hypothetical protein
LISAETAREELQAVVKELEGIQGRLLEIGRGLPPPPPTPEDDLADPDAPTEMKRVIECVLHDCVGPAIRDLLAAVEYRLGVKAKP